MHSSPEIAERLTRLLRPQSLAILGASAKRPASGNEAIANLIAHQFAGDLHVVHPTASSIDGLPAVRDASELPIGLDTALVSLRPSALLPALTALASRGCQSAIVPTVGLNELQMAGIYSLAAETGMLVHGPNCMGVLNVSDDIPLWFYDGMLTEERRGSVAIVSQSGSASMFVVRSTTGVGFSKIISTGSELVLSSSDYLSWLASDDDTTAVGLVLESLANLTAFVSAVRALREAGKPLVVLKVGRSVAGSSASAAHTGALIGRDDAYQALFRELDVPIVRDYDELASALECFGVTELPKPAGTRVGVITISGGQAALAADLAGDQGVELPQFSRATRSSLLEAQPGASPLNPFDAGASIEAPEDGYRDSVALIASDPNVDSVMVILDAQATLNDREVAYTLEEFEAVASVAKSVSDKPLIVASSSGVSLHPRYVSILSPEIPFIRGISNGFAALRVLAGNSIEIPASPKRGADLPDDLEVGRLRGQIEGHVGSVPSQLLADVLAAYGITTVRSAIVSGPATAAQFAGTVGFPLVAKISSSQVPHRSDIGGVVTNIRTHAELDTAINTIRQNVERARPEIATFEIELQRQASGAEAIVGFVSDPVFGAVVTVGTGGTLVELENDTHTMRAPVGIHAARSMIEGTRLGSYLAGYRNLSPVTNLEPLADLIRRVSWLAWDLRDVLAAGDFNPAIVTEATGVLHIVDALLISSSDGSSTIAQKLEVNA